MVLHCATLADFFSSSLCNAGHIIHFASINYLTHPYAFTRIRDTLR